MKLLLAAAPKTLTQTPEQTTRWTAWQLRSVLWGTKLVASTACLKSSQFWTDSCAGPATAEAVLQQKLQQKLCRSRSHSRSCAVAEAAAEAVLLSFLPGG